jgi:hypothetical protein
MSDKWPQRFELIRAFGWLALPGAVLIIVALLTSELIQKWTAVFGVLLILPALIYTFVVIMWHWKDRYRGKHSDLWGALILVETSGWMKIVYLFRHLIPDMRHTGRYRIPLDYRKYLDHPVSLDPPLHPPQDLPS